MKIYEWGDNTNWISCTVYTNKKELLNHIKKITNNTNYAYGDKAYIWEIDTKLKTRTKISTIDLK